MLSLPQIARTWFAATAQPLRAARKAVALLQRVGLVAVETFVVHPELALPAPLVTWEPGLDAPNLGALAYRLESRWPLAPLPTAMVIATRQAAARFAGYGGRHSRRSEASHDQSLAGLYLKMRAQSPDRARAWLPESALHAQGWGRKQPLPDALLRFPDAQELVIEFAGSYPRHRLERLHAFCFGRDLPYEIW